MASANRTTRRSLNTHGRGAFGQNVSALRGSQSILVFVAFSICVANQAPLAYCHIGKVPDVGREVGGPNTSEIALSWGTANVSTLSADKVVRSTDSPVGRGGLAHTIAVTSGKGGVGKSNVALNVAVLLSATRRRVALIDADLGLANLDVLTGVTPRGDLSHVLAGQRRLADVILDYHGVRFLPGASGLAELAGLSPLQRVRLLEQMTSLEASADVALVDCGAGIGPGVLQLALPADEVLVVVTPEPTALTDGYATIKVLVQRGFTGPIRVVVNQSATRAEAHQTFARLQTVARRFLGRELVDGSYVLWDPKLPQAVRRREPVVMAWPRSPAARCLATVANRLASADKDAGGGSSFFHRLTHWLA